MTFASRVLPAAQISLALLALGMASSSAIAQTLDAHVAPAVSRFGKNMGLESPTTKLTLTAWLNLHNRAAFDAKVNELYTPSSPSFHKWLSDQDMKAFAPTAAELAAVKAELAQHNLKVTYVDPMNYAVRFEGTTAEVEKAFNTQISRYSVRGELVRTSSRELAFSGPAASLVKHVSGLNSMKLHPMLSAAINPRTGKKYGTVPAEQAKALKKSNGVIFASDCFYAPASVTLTGVNALDGTTPVTSTFGGLTYGANPNNTVEGTLPPCGYSAAQVQKFYGLDKAYKFGYSGAGQTIVILDSYLEPTALPDLELFSTLNNLPAPTAASFKVLNPFGADETGQQVGDGVDEETDLDVQWTHATAPGANLVLLQSFSEDEEDQQAALLYAVTAHLGNVISFSYGYNEKFTGPVALELFNEVAEMAAAQGVALNVSSGDSGDNAEYGLGTDVSAPADSPYATAVGGTSIGTSPVDGTIYTTGWGNNITYLSFDSTDPFDPPQTGFYAGSGGGESGEFAKPAYQAKLPGSKRLVPDVSALADPFTGAEFVVTDPNTGEQGIGVVGGTSLAAPIFSGIWTLVNQAAGHSLGQAAPYIAEAPGYIINDVVPFTGPANVTATITDPSGTTKYSAVDLAQPLFTTTDFVSALYNVGGGEYVGVTFGTDTSLTVSQGWDNVTGYGTPNLAPVLTALGSLAK